MQEKLKRKKEILDVIEARQAQLNKATYINLDPIRFDTEFSCPLCGNLMLGNRSDFVTCGKHGTVLIAREAKR